MTTALAGSLAVTADDAARADRRRTTFVLATMGVALTWSVGSAVVRGGWISATMITALVFAAFAGYALRFRDGLLARLVVMGTFTGLLELLADRWLVEVTRTLVYAADEPFLLRSPVYMPGAWAGVLVPVGYVGWLATRRFGLLRGSLACAAFGALYVPVYEIIAFYAGWWVYVDTPMLGKAPWYIVAGEGLFGLVLPFTIRSVETRPLAWSVVAGSLVGLWIWPAYALAWAVVG